MAVAIGETWNSRRVSDDPDDPRIELEFQIVATNAFATDAQAFAAARQNSPSIFEKLFLQHLDCEPVDAGVWMARAQYGRRNPIASSFAFEISTETVHITVAKETVAGYDALGPMVDPGVDAIIGMTHDSVEGVDMLVPVYRFTERHNLPISMVTFDYRRKLFKMTAKTNSTPWRGFAAGEVLFEGSQGTDEDAGVLEGTPWELVPVDFRFAASENAVNLKVGPITVLSKKGWEYLDVRYRDAEDAAGKKLIKKPVEAYVQRIYDKSDFEDLGIGK